MKKLDLSEVPKGLKPDPVFKGLPENLKDVKIFNKVEKQLAKTIETTHRHKAVKTYTKCKECQDKFKKRQELLKELGFTNYQQYFQWRKIMHIIKSQKSFSLR